MIFILQQMKQIFIPKLYVVKIVCLQVQTVTVHSHWKAEIVPLAASSCVHVSFYLSAIVHM